MCSECMRLGHACPYHQRIIDQAERTREHHPVGAYLPVGQLDGDCSCGNGPWPCPQTPARYD